MPASHDDPDRPAAPTLEGREVRLRPATAADRDRLREILEEPSVARWWGPPRPGVDVADDWLEAGPDIVVFAIELGGAVVGSIQCAEENEPDYRHAGIDLFLSTDWQGRGLGTDAIRTLAHFLFEARGHHRLVIDPSAANERAIAAYRKVGFVPVGVMRAYERGPDGTFHDGLLLDLLAGELT
jgi:aminoglycoside 6'-N-acetyltransferase